MKYIGKYLSSERLLTCERSALKVYHRTVKKNTKNPRNHYQVIHNGYNRLLFLVLYFQIYKLYYFFYYLIFFIYPYIELKILDIMGKKI